MGRKIPGKKHRTVKDPKKQMQQRIDRLSSRINNPPSNYEQEIPKSLLKIMELKKKAKQETDKKPKRNKNMRRKRPTLPSIGKVLDKDKIHKGMTKPDKYIPNLVPKPNESAKSYLGRVNLMTQNLINEVEFEKKFGVDIKKNPETGEVIEVKMLKKKNSKSKKKKLREKRNAKLELKKENMKNIKDFNQWKDIVEFGEVVHRPPNLSALKKLGKNEVVKKPGFNNLLLNNVISKDVSKTENKMSDLAKEKLESERKFIVEAYKQKKRIVSNV